MERRKIQRGGRKEGKERKGKERKQASKRKEEKKRKEKKRKEKKKGPDSTTMSTSPMNKARESPVGSAKMQSVTLGNKASMRSMRKMVGRKGKGGRGGKGGKGGKGKRMSITIGAQENHDQAKDLIGKVFSPRPRMSIEMPEQLPLSPGIMGEEIEGKRTCLDRWMLSNRFFEDDKHGKMDNNDQLLHIVLTILTAIFVGYDIYKEDAKSLASQPDIPLEYSVIGRKARLFIVPVCVQALATFIFILLGDNFLVKLSSLRSRKLAVISLYVITALFSPSLK